MYNLITREFTSQQNEIARLVIEAVSPEKLFMLGCSISHVRTESIFAYNAPTCKSVSDYYLLVLVNTNNTCGCDAIQDKVENCVRSFIPVTAIVIDIHQFNGWLTEGHPFANTVCKIAECMYDAENTPLAAPQQIDEQRLAKANASIFSEGLNRVQEFLAGADLYRIREQNKMAAFMLHQAAEQALRTLFKITTGLHIHTHNIDKLLRYCAMASYKLPAIFRRNNEKNERLFQLLQKAYIHTRYKDDYIICTEDLITLTERVRTLKSIVEETYNRKKV